MDLLSLGIILLILVASGGIAFVADGLGKKIGKKRLSVFGLRPKHVASLGTVMMGVVVSALTIGFVAAVSRDAREWLREGRGLLHQRDELQQNVNLQKAQLGSLNVKIGDDRAQIGKEQDELRKGGEEVRRLDLQVRRLDGDLQAKNAALGEAKIELDHRQALLQRQGQQLATLHRNVQSARGQVDVANARLGQIKGRLAVAQRDLKTASLDLQTARHNKHVAVQNQNDALTTSFKTYNENVALNKALEEEVKTRQELVSSLKAEEAGLVAQRDEAQAQADGAQARYTEIRGQLEGADKELVQTQEALQNVLNSGFKTSRTEAMTFRRGEEIARVVVPAGADLATTRAALAALLQEARTEATERGAKGHRAGGQTFEAAQIVDRKDPKTGVVIDADTLKRSLIAGLAGKREDEALVATSSLNAFAGEPVSIDLSVLPNPVVYRRNDTMAEARIDGGQPEDRILAQLSAFVNGPVRQQAAKDHMIPRAGASAPYGEPSAADVWTLLQSVRKAGRPVRVQAVAKDDIRAADPLRLEFKVR